MKPVRSSPITPEDTSLRGSLAKITEDVYYSRRKRKLFNLQQVQAMFDVEQEVYMSEPDFKAHCEHLQICNVNVYIFNPEIDALFTLADLRASQKALHKLQTCAPSLDPYVLLQLLGYGKVEQPSILEPQPIAYVQPEVKTFADIQPEVKTSIDIQPEVKLVADVQTPLVIVAPQSMLGNLQSPLVVHTTSNNIIKQPRRPRRWFCGTPVLD